MSNQGFEDHRAEGEKPTPARDLTEPERPLEGPGSEERLQGLRHKFRSSDTPEGLPTSQLILIGITVFLIVLMFGAGRYVITALAPKPPPGVNAPP